MRLGTWRDALRPIVGLIAFYGFLVAAAAAMLGAYFLGEWIFPRNNGAQLVAAGVGLAIGAALWWPIFRRLGRFIQTAPPPRDPTDRRGDARP